MSEAARRESPLVDIDMEQTGAADASVVLAERPLQGFYNLRGDPADAKFVRIVSDVLAVVPPTAPNTVMASDALRVFWLGPDEWLIAINSPDYESLLHVLRGALSDRHVALTEVSGGFTVIRIHGHRARAVLAKGCTLDLHPRVFSPDQCAQTLLAKAGVLLHLVADDEVAGPTFDLIVRSSFVDYLWRWLEDASLEFGFAAARP